MSVSSIPPAFAPSWAASSSDAQRDRISELVRTTESLRGWGGLARMKVFAGLLALGVAGSTGFMIKHQHDSTLARTTAEIESMAVVLSHQAARTLQAAELVQRAILERVGEVRTPEQFRAALRGREIHEELRQRIQGLPQIDAVTAIDVDGNLINFSRYWPIPPVNVADRDYFKALRADPGLGIFISVPVRNRGTGTWTAYLARSATNAEGEFLGLILVGLDLSYFEQLYREAGFGTHSSVAIFRDDGVLLARYPFVTPSATPVERLRDSIRLARETHSARGVVYGTPESLDGKPRLVAVMPLAQYPLGIGVTASLDSALAAWKKQAVMLAGAGLLLELAIGGMALLVVRQLRNQRRLAEANLARGHAEAELATVWAQAEADRAARARDARFVLALNSLSQGLCMFDGQGRLVLLNQRFEAMFALPHGSLAAGTRYPEVLAGILGQPAGAEESGLVARARTFVRDRMLTAFTHDHPDGRAWSVTMVPEDNGGWLMTFEDVTERRQAEAKAAFLARHDALTGLANRTLFRERLETAIAGSTQGERFALLCLDLDRFKWVNDTMGHPVGDALLRAVAERLRNNCRTGTTISRLGGDEFAVIHRMGDDPTEAMAVAERLITGVSRPYRLEGQDVRIGTSVGIALIPSDGDVAATLLKRADLALYLAKKNRGSFAFFEPELERAAQARPLLETALRTALAEQQFEVHYQPVVDMRSKTLTGLEALVRWRHPDRGLVGPSEFVPLAEEVGLIQQIDEWVLNCACEDASGWPSSVRVSVNLSTRHFVDAGPIPMVRAALAASKLAPGRLELEITETAKLEATEPVIAMMHGLKALGVRLAMDDLGAGYARLEYLRCFPLDTVKIDKSIVDDVGSAEKSRAIIDSLGNLCSRLGLASTVEGVETEEQLRELQQSLCTNVQGFLFGRPEPAERVPDMLRRLGPRDDGGEADRRVAEGAGAPDRHVAEGAGDRDRLAAE